MEPLDLGFVEGVGELDVVGLTVLGVDTESDRLADLEFSAQQVDSVGRLDLVVVGGIGEGQRKHTLLLQVGFVLERSSVSLCGARDLIESNLQYGQSCG